MNLIQFISINDSLPYPFDINKYLDTEKSLLPFVNLLMLSVILYYLMGTVPQMLWGTITALYFSSNGEEITKHTSIKARKVYGKHIVLNVGRVIKCRIETHKNIFKIKCIY